MGSERGGGERPTGDPFSRQGRGTGAAARICVDRRGRWFAGSAAPGSCRDCCMPQRRIAEAEQRRAKRVSVDLRARYRSSTLDLDGRVSNLSRSGMFLRADFLDDEGSAVDLELE